MGREYKIKPKKTKYGPNIFESVLEARWAVFFDCLGINYIYEPECAEVETGCRVVHHKPDFLLPELRKYIEIKPSKPYRKENIKAAGWSKYIGDIIILFNLNPPSEKVENGWLFSYEELCSTPIIFEDFCWGECPRCGHIDLEEYGQITSCGCFTLDELNKIYEDEQEKCVKISPNFEKSDRLLAAYKIAQKYKFDNAKSKRVPKLPVQYSLI